MLSSKEVIVILTFLIIFALKYSIYFILVFLCLITFLSAILQKITGVTLLQYLKPRIFIPLDIEDATWEACPRGINTGGFGLNIKTEDIAKFGQLYLQKGMWNGVQI